MKNHYWLLLAALGLLAAGCQSNSSTVTPKEDTQIRNNLSRQLTPEEISQMGGGGKAGSQPAAPPSKKAGGT